MRVEQRGQVWAVMSDIDIVCAYSSKEAAEAARDAILQWRAYEQLKFGR